MIDDKNDAERMPQTIGRYEVKECVGFGAMGAVYKGFDPLIKRTLAIKTIRLDIPRQSPQYKSFIERFYHEARISGTLSHPNIVTLFDIGEEGGLPYLAMEYVEGETLAAMIDKGTRFKPELVVGLVSQIASAIDYAHGMGVVHRDIKPSNLILSSKERIKVTDFGIAKLVDAEMTQSGTLLGTPSYMSPEQAMGEAVDGRSDIFSLGVCAFEMLSGEQPFPGNNVTAILYKLAHVDPVEPANLELNGLVPEKWHEVFGKVLAKKPDERYQTAADFVRDLEYCLGSWFGSAVGDETVAEGASLAAMDADATSALPRLPVKTKTPTAIQPPVPVAASEADGSLTRPMKTGVPQPPPPVPAGSSPDRTIMLPPGAPVPPPPPPAPDEEPLATVIMSAPVVAAAPPPDVERTVLMPARAASAPPAGMPGAPALKAGIPPAAPPPMPSPAVATVVMPSTLKVSEAEVRAAISGPDPTAKRPAGPGPTPAPAPARTPVPPAAGGAVPTPKKGVPVGLIVAGVLALLFLGGVLIGGVWLVKHYMGGPSPAPTPEVLATPVATPTPAPTPTAAPEILGALLVESEPVGATVSVNGELRGVTPLALDGLALGDYEVKVESKGYQPSTQTVTLADDQPLPVRAVLTRAAPVTASIDVLSTPFGAVVVVDGTGVGQTPLSGYKLKPGSHRIEIMRPGFEPWSETVKLAGGQSQRVDVNLKALPTPKPSPTIEAVDPTKVYALADVDTAPRKISGASPSYPDGAKRLKSGESVSARLSFVVTENGEVTEVNVVESGGKAVDDAVAAAVKSWKYTPGQKRGTKVKVQMTTKQTFQAG